MTPEEVTREVRRIEITTRRLVRDIVAGEYSSAFRGRGVEFAEVREYQPGDDMRTIDWNVTARLGAAYVKRYLEERELSVLFVVDLSASGAFGSRRRTKGELATEVAAVLALAAVRNNDRVGATFFTDRVEYHLAPAKGRRHALRLISDLLAFEPVGTGTDLGLALAEVEPTLRRRAVIFVLSDFMSTGYEHRAGPAVPAPRRGGIAAGGSARAGAAGRGASSRCGTPRPAPGGGSTPRTPTIRAHFARRAAEFDHGLERGLRERGADLLRLETGQPYAEPLLTFFRRRERMLWR